MPEKSWPNYNERIQKKNVVVKKETEKKISRHSIFIKQKIQAQLRQVIANSVSHRS